MPTANAQRQSFALSNIIPQDARGNRGAWAGVEGMVRDYAATKPVYVITGALFVGQQIGFLKGRVAVPTHVYKIVYDPRLRAGVVYVLPNQPGGRVAIVALASLQQSSRIDYGLGQVSFLQLPAPGAGFPGEEP